MDAKTANCDITVKFADITIVKADGTVIGEIKADGVFEQISVVHNKSYKLTDSFAAEYAELGGFENGKYTAVAKAVIEINGASAELKATLPIKIK